MSILLLRARFPEWDAVRREVYDVQGGVIPDEYTLKSFIRELKRGSGNSGNCYEIVDLMTGLAVKMDAARKVSALLDTGPRKNPAYGASGYYHATQSTASLQQTLSRGDNRGNLITSSQTVSDPAWITAQATKSGSGVGPNGETSTIISPTAQFGKVSHIYPASVMAPGRSYVAKMLLKSDSPQKMRFDYGGGGDTGAAQFNFTASGAWEEITLNFTAGTGAGTQREILINATDASFSPFQIARAYIRESAWEDVYIQTTSTPVFAGLDGNPVMMFNAGLGVTTGYTASGIETRNQPGTVFVIARKDGGGTVGRWLFGGPSATALAGGYQSNTTQMFGTGGATLSFNTTQETYGMLAFQFNGVSSTVRRKGVQIAAGGMGANQSAGTLIIGNSSVNQPHNGPIALAIAIRQAITNAQRDHIESVINTFYPSTQ